MSPTSGRQDYKVWNQNITQSNDTSNTFHIGLFYMSATFLFIHPYLESVQVVDVSRDCLLAKHRRRPIGLMNGWKDRCRRFAYGARIDATNDYFIQTVQTIWLMPLCSINGSVAGAFVTRHYRLLHSAHLPRGRNSGLRNPGRST